MIKPYAVNGGIKVLSCTASYFGGTDDKEDNGIGFFGFNYRQYPDFPGCALPVRSGVPSLRNSPLPMLQHFQPVHVYSEKTGKAVWCFFVDLGPTGSLSNGNRGIDLNPAAVAALGLPPDDLYDGITYFIPGVAGLLHAL